jgi:hypothetical protein
VRSKGIVLWWRHESIVRRIVNMKRIERGRIVRNVVQSSVHIMKILLSEMGMKVSVCEVCPKVHKPVRRKEKKKGGTSLS